MKSQVLDSNSVKMKKKKKDLYSEWVLGRSDYCQKYKNNLGEIQQQQQHKTKRNCNCNTYHRPLTQ